MQISPPYGYKEIVPFDRSKKIKLPHAGELPGFAGTTNAIPISYVEFSVACHDYPLVFATSDSGRSYSPVAVIGLANGENLFVKDGKWDPQVYLPAYVRRYPFCMSRVTRDGVEQEQRLICVEQAFLSDEGEMLFDDKGAPLETWKPIEQLLREYEADIERSREMCGILTDYALFEPFTLQAQVTGGAALNLSGMFRVDEKKLEFLNAAQHKNLIKKGIMGRIYAHLISLENFGRLITHRGPATPAAA
ncbi:MAG: SapC family protein [Betaproteobacteria bacterium]